MCSPFLCGRWTKGVRNVWAILGVLGAKGTLTTGIAWRQAALFDFAKEIINGVIVVGTLKASSAWRGVVPRRVKL